MSSKLHRVDTILLKIPTILTSAAEDLVAAACLQRVSYYLTLADGEPGIQIHGEWVDGFEFQWGDQNLQQMEWPSPYGTQRMQITFA